MKIKGKIDKYGRVQISKEIFNQTDFYCGAGIEFDIENGKMTVELDCSVTYPEERRYENERKRNQKDSRAAKV